MLEFFINNNLRDMAAEKVFLNENIRIVPHIGDPGTTGKNQAGNYINGLPNNEGIITNNHWVVDENRNLKNTFELISSPLSSTQTITHFSLWRESNDTFLVFIKLKTGITIISNDTIRINAGSIKIKF